jgi:hypothetical protein
MTRTLKIVFACGAMALLASPLSATTYLGGDGVTTVIRGIEVPGTTPLNLNLVDNAYYEVTNRGGAANPAVYLTHPAPCRTGDPAYFGATFLNPTDTAIVVTQVDLVSSPRELFRLGGGLPAGVRPTTGWAWISNFNLRWTGTVSVPAHGAYDFIVNSQATGQNNNSVSLIGTVLTSTGQPFVSAEYPTQTSGTNFTANVYYYEGAQRDYVEGVDTHFPKTFTVQLKETSNGGDIPEGTTLTITIPRTWSNVSVPSGQIGWGPAAIVQPTATTDGRIVVTDTLWVKKNTAQWNIKDRVNANFVFTVTPPNVGTHSLYLFPTVLSGNGISSRCDAAVQAYVAPPSGGIGGELSRQVLMAVPNPGQANKKAYFGVATFVNPTDTPVVVTQVDLFSDVDFFNKVTNQIRPGSGWKRINARNIRWTGVVGVDAHGAFDFMVVASLTGHDDVLANITGVARISGGGSYTSPVYHSSTAHGNTPVANVYYLSGGAIHAAVTGPISGMPASLTVEIRESANTRDIPAGTTLNIVVPKTWAAIVVPGGQAGWGPAAIVQPTLTTDGRITVSTTTPILRNTVRDFNYTATAPLGIQTNSLYKFPTYLTNGSTSVCDAIVQVLPPPTCGIMVQHTSPVVTDDTTLVTSLSVELHLKSTANTLYFLQIYNFATASWENLNSDTVGTNEQTWLASITSDIPFYMDPASQRIRVRVFSMSTLSHTLQENFLAYEVTSAYWADAINGSDLNPGTRWRPFQTILHAAAVMRGGQICYVRNGTYDGDIPIQPRHTGRALFPTIFQAEDGQYPVVSNPGMVNGFFDSAGAYVRIQGFTVRGASQVGVYLYNARHCEVLENTVEVPDFGYGILSEGGGAHRIDGNTVSPASGATFPFEGVWIYQSDSLEVSGNRVDRMADCGIRVDFGSNGYYHNNISTGNVQGMDFVYAGSNRAYNNTCHGNRDCGIHANNLAGTITTLNNSLTNNDFGCGRYDLMGNITSDFNNLWGNRRSDYVYYNGYGVTPGANDIHSDPLYEPDYSLQAGSPLIDAGTDVGLPFVGAAPDIGAVEFGLFGAPGVQSGKDQPSLLPKAFGISQNYPNPVNRETRINYQLPKSATVSLKIYNISGQIVKTLMEEVKTPGYHSVRWDRKDSNGKEVGSGIYLYRFTAGDYSAVKKLLVVR